MNTIIKTNVKGMSRLYPLYPYPSYSDPIALAYPFGSQLAYWPIQQPIPPIMPQVRFSDNSSHLKLKDYGKEPLVINIHQAAAQNRTFRTAIWTGSHLQVTVMSIEVGEDIGLEVHPDVDQFLRIEDGQGVVQMGDKKNQLHFEKHVYPDDAIMVPAGTWHNVTNTGHVPLKLYSIYAPPEHPPGTVHPTKAEALAAEESYR